MKIIYYCLPLLFGFSLLSCSSTTTENEADTVLKEEIENLDSLNQEVTQTTQSIEASIDSVQAAMEELEEF